MSRDGPDRGSAGIWLLACCALLLAVAFAGTLHAAAVVVRHRVESAADLAALAAAGQIGVSEGLCAAAGRIAMANAATVRRCQPVLAPGGRSGSVTVWLTMRVRLPVIGSTEVVASARAGRDAVVSQRRTRSRAAHDFVRRPGPSSATGEHPYVVVLEQPGERGPLLHVGQWCEPGGVPASRRSRSSGNARTPPEPLWHDGRCRPSSSRSPESAW